MIVPGPIYKIFVQKYNYKKINLNSETTIPPRKIERYGEPNEILIRIFSYLSKRELEMGYSCCKEFALACFTLMSRRIKNFRLTIDFCYFCRKEGKNGYVLDNCIEKCIFCREYICYNCDPNFHSTNCTWCSKCWSDLNLEAKNCLCLCGKCKILYHPKKMEKCVGCKKRFCNNCYPELFRKKRIRCFKCWSENWKRRNISPVLRFYTCIGCGKKNCCGYQEEVFRKQRNLCSKCDDFEF